MVFCFGGRNSIIVPPRRVYDDRCDLTCKAPDVLYEEVVEIDERVMLSEYYDEDKSDEEIDMLERTSPTIQSGGQYSFDWPKAGIGKRIAGVTGEKVSCFSGSWEFVFGNAETISILLSKIYESRKYI